MNHNILSKRKGKRDVTALLSLTAMVDMFTVLVIFLLQNYNTTGEILYIPNVPVKASLNEYIDISKEYSTPNSKTFVNGVLDKIIAELKRDPEVQTVAAHSLYTILI